MEFISIWNELKAYNGNFSISEKMKKKAQNNRKQINKTHSISKKILSLGKNGQVVAGISNKWLYGVKHDDFY